MDGPITSKKSLSKQQAQAPGNDKRGQQLAVKSSDDQGAQE